MTTYEAPPLTPDEARAVLQQLGDLTSKIVLVGGQALAFWANHYADRIRPTGPVNSKDIDFCGFTDAVEIAAERLGGTFQIPEPFSNTPNTGLVAFKDRRGQERRMDFLGDVYGLDSKEVIEWAIEVEVPVVGGDIAFKVMHPFHCLKSRISKRWGPARLQDAPCARSSSSFDSMRPRISPRPARCRR